MKYKDTLTMYQQKIFKYLLARYDGGGSGLHCAVSGRDLAAHTGLDARTLRAVYADMVMAGYSVGSSNAKGYFLVIDRADEREAVMPEIKRLNTIRKRIEKVSQNRLSKRMERLFRVPNTTPRPLNAELFGGAIE